MAVKKELKDFNLDIIEIIETFPMNKEFSSHKFIQKFTQKYQRFYVIILSNNISDHAFQTVHAQIATHLSLNETAFGIKKTRKGDSKDIFGDMVEVQWWKRTK